MHISTYFTKNRQKCLCFTHFSLIIKLKIKTVLSKGGDFMNTFLKFKNVLRGSKEYSMNGSILTIRSYRTGEEFTLDLAKLTEEDFEKLTNEEENLWETEQ